ncbi:MAG TPA: transposase [Acetobacteraceae bacterium]
MEIITRGERRRSWTADRKSQIVAESLGPELTPTEVARKHGISTGQLYTWRQRHLNVPTALVTRAVPRFAQVELTPAPFSAGAADPKPADAYPPSTPSSLSRPEGLIEVVLPGGVVVRMDAHVDGSALRRVLGALEGR